MCGWKGNVSSQIKEIATIESVIPVLSIRVDEENSTCCSSNHLDREQKLLMSAKSKELLAAPIAASLTLALVHALLLPRLWSASFAVGP
jgi:hypothetical protein